MTLIFGWNHFRIKSFDPAELGLAQHADPNVTIEVRQRYFHFFWIPFFSLGKKWAIRRNNELYEMPLALTSTIRQRNDLKVKTPWYTYAGVLLVALCSIGFAVQEKFESRAWKERERQLFAAEYAQNLELFRKPSPDDYCLLTAVNGYAQKYAKVTRLDKQHIELSYITNPAAHGDMDDPPGIAGLFVQYANDLQTITISRGDSSRLFCSDYDQRHSFAGLTLQDKQGLSYRVKKIIRLDGPILTAGAVRSFVGEEFALPIRNVGYDTEIFKVEPVKGAVEWLQEGFPVTLENGNTILVRGRGRGREPFTVKITCTNVSGKEITYLVESDGRQPQLTRL
jgi:hypothetical protein